MKVLHLSSERSWRGGEQQIAYLIKELEKQGVDCFVACRKKSAFEDWCIQNDIPFLPLAFANEFDLFTAWQIRNFCRDMEVDIVHMHSGHSHAIGVWSAILGNKSRLILSRRVDFPVKNNWFSRFKYNYKRIEKIVCVSDAIRRITAQSLKNPGKCVTVYSGIDPERFKDSKRTYKLHDELGIFHDTRCIANISAIAPHKDYETFVRVAKKMLDEDFRAKFLILGEGPEEEKIRQLVSDLRLKENVIFLGFRNDVPEIICDLDVLLITSKTEGLGTTILDAFATRIPVVATRAGGIPEIVQNRETGLLADVGDVTGLANSVIEVFEDNDLRNYISQQAEIKFLDNFTNESMASNMLKVYRKQSFPLI